MYNKIKEEEEDVDIDSLEYHESKEDFKINEFQEKHRAMMHSLKSSLPDSEESSTVPEFYFDLTKTGQRPSQPGQKGYSIESRMSSRK